MGTKKLYRSNTEKILGGVARGLAEYLEIDPLLVRLVFILLILAGPGIILYIIAWIIIPQAPLEKTLDSELEIKGVDTKREEKIFSSKIDKTKTKSKEKYLFWVGIILIVFGSILTAETVLGVNLWGQLWPIILIVVGLVVVIRGYKL